MSIEQLGAVSTVHAIFATVPSPAPALNWRALATFPELLVRRTCAKYPGPGGWVVMARRSTGPYVPEPLDQGTWAGRLVFDHPGVLDRPVGGLTSSGLHSAWWRPDMVLQWDGVRPGRGAESAEAPLLDALLATAEKPVTHRPIALWERRTPKDRYLATVRKLLAHIQRGDIYEINYCTERTTQLEDFDPYAAFARLLDATDAPFASLYRSGDLFALCMSPERFLRIEGRQVLTEPMKGTRRRSRDAAEDAVLAHELAQDPKERSENIMAVDVARHDLSRIAAPGSVQVPELCAVRTYPNVHQLVSTVRAELRNGLGPWDAVRAAFPMASMTGAPKRRALELITEAEEMPRGLFSGSLGFQLPDGTLDLNVVIRTLTWDARTGRASLITGGAITAQSDAEQEWEECELKARSILDAL